MEYILASNNQGKINELKAMLGIEIKSLDDLGFTEEIEEFGLTFEQNALIKAQAIAKVYPEAIIISDDSGLEVRALDYAPGVYSKRYSGATTNVDSANNELMLSQMADQTDRYARFRTTLCVYSEKYQLCHFFNGQVEGEIATQIEGENGFGYDPIFLYNGTSFANLSKEQKNSVSHRADALQKLLQSGVINV